MQLKPASPFSSRLKRFSIAFLACSLVLTGYLLTRHPVFKVTIEIATEYTSVAQLFFNTGAGFNEKESQAAMTAVGGLDSFKTLSFDMPRNTVTELRFDPMTTAGTVVLRDIKINGPNGFEEAIPASSILPFNQIKSRSQQNNEVRFVTTPGATDPGLRIPLAHPFRSKRMRAFAKIRRIAAANGILLLIFWLAFSSNRFTMLFLSRLQRIAERFSKSDFIKLDVYALWFYVICIFCFIVAVAADLNGSSVEIYSKVYGYGFENAPLIGEAQAIRSDEFVYHTPAILNEAIRPDRFAVNPSPLGNHSIALTGNLPLRHFTTLFRPQFWPFFVLPLDYAYSAYWQFKALLLVCGVFTLLLLFTESTFWSVTGALWYFFSPLTQWDYHWASLLPEMIGLICLIIVLCCYITVGRNLAQLLIAAVLAGVCAVNFTLCGYPPHLIPLFWFGIFVFVSWCVANRRRIFVRALARRRMLAMLVTLSIPAVAGAFIFLELHQAITAVSATEYPGQRELSGGTLPFQEMLAYLFAWSEKDQHLPPALGNMCEGSGFLLLAPFTLFCLGRAVLSSWNKSLLITLWMFFGFLVIWATEPIPANIAQFAGLDKVGGARLVPALGLANISIVVITIASMRKRLAVEVLHWPRVVVDAAGAVIVTLLALLYANRSYGNYFTLPEILIALAITSALIVLLVEGRKMAFAVMLIVPHVYAFGEVSPIQRGLSVFTNSQLFTYLNQHPALRTGRWLVYSDTIVASGFFTAAGCETYTGLRYMPDIDHFSLWASHGISPTIFNRDGYLTARALDPDKKASAELIAPYFVRLSVAPTDDIVRKLGIQYVAFNSKPADVMVNHLVALSSAPQDGFWLYRIP